METRGGAPHHLNPKAPGGGLERLVEALLQPVEVTPAHALKALKRARRTGALRILTPMERALLKAAAQARVTRYKNPRIKRLLSTIIAKIETHTKRGTVLLLGLRRALSLGAAPLNGGPRALLDWARRKLDYIRYLGRSMLAILDYYRPYM